MNPWRQTFLTGVIVCLLACSNAWAQQPTAAAPEKKGPPKDPYGRTTPRGTVLGFLKAAQTGRYDAASLYLQLTPEKRKTQGEALARDLKEILDQQYASRILEISEKPEGSLTVGLPSGETSIGKIQGAEEEVDLILVRIEDKEAGPIWLFSSKTLKNLPAIHEALRFAPLEEHLPAFLTETQFLGVSLWKWLLNLLLIPIFLLALWLLLGAVGWILKLAGRPGKRNLAKLAFNPPGWMLVILLHWLCMRQVGVPLLFRHYQDKVMTWAFLIVVVWLAMRLVDIAVDSLSRRIQKSNQGFAMSIFGIVRQAAKAILILIAILITLAGLGFNIGTALAGVGIGGIALALGAQKSLEHLIGGITVLSDRVLHVGDRCRLGSQIGTVEDISLRSTKIRTLEGSLLAVPNGVMAMINLENLSNRDRFLFNPVIGVRYETTAEQMENLVKQLRNLLAQQPKVAPESLRVCFKGFGASSLEVEIFADIVTGDFLEFVRIREELLLAIMRIVEAVGTGFAFPSQTLYLRRDAGLPAKHP